MSMRRDWLLWVALVVGMAAPPAPALDVRQPAAQYRASSWGVASGLPHASISALFQDRDGYLWVGTYQGAARFDGVRFVALSELATGEVPTDMIETIAQTPDGALWFGGRYRGLTRLDGAGRLQRFRADAGLPSDSVTVLRVHPQGGLWLGTGAGLFHARFDGATSELREELPQVVWALSQDRLGRWWAGSENGFWRRERDGWVPASSDPQLLRAHVWSLAFDASGNGYGGFRGGAAITRGDAFVPWALAEPWPSSVVRAVLPEAEGAIWLATAGGGLARVRGDAFERFTRRNGLASDVVWEATMDREGNLWAGTAAGLTRIGDSLVQTYGAAEDLPQGLAWTVVPRRAGGWWLGFNGGGLVAFEHGRRIELPAPRDAPPGSGVVQTVLDRGDVQWLGTAGGLVRRSADGALEVVPELRGLRIQAVVEGGAGSLLVGTQNGLVRWHQGQVTPIELPGAPRPAISRLRSDGPGRWLVAAADAGVYQLDGDQAQRLSDGEGQPIRDAVRAPDGRVWVAGVGLHVLEGGRMRAIEPINRQLLAQFHAIEFDAQGRLWTSSNAGVLRVELAALARHLDGVDEALDYTLFGEAEGMRSSECNGGTQHPLALADDGAVWVATTEGVVRIGGDALPERAPLPLPRIERVLVDGISHAASPGLELAAGTRQIGIDYTALRLSDAERLRFRYRLLPSLTRWSEVGARRSVAFDALAPGNYRFEVAVSTPTEPWSAAVALDFSVHPHWWQRGDVRLLAVLAMLALAAALPLWRLRALRRRERALEALVRARTHDLELANAALAQAASNDFLTGLPNRRAFAHKLDAAFADAPSSAVAMLDVDHFKAYNDSAGHLAGDECLARFGAELAACAQQFGVDAARIGGEEFAVLFRADAVEQAGAFLDAFVARIRALAIPHPASSCAAVVTFSAGLAVRGGSETRPQELIGRADEALYRAKAAGRNRWQRAD